MPAGPGREPGAGRGAGARGPARGRGSGERTAGPPPGRLGLSDLPGVSSPRVSPGLHLSWPQTAPTPTSVIFLPMLASWPVCVSRVFLSSSVFEALSSGLKVNVSSLMTTSLFLQEEGGIRAPSSLFCPHFLSLSSWLSTP